jgi:hypothetical protein
MERHMRNMLRTEAGQSQRALNPSRTRTWNRCFDIAPAERPRRDPRFRHGKWSPEGTSAAYLLFKRFLRCDCATRFMANDSSCAEVCGLTPGFGPNRRHMLNLEAGRPVVRSPVCGNGLWPR